MKRAALIFLLILLTPLVFALMFKRVPPATIGVKQNNWGGGIIEQDYRVGYHLGITGYHKWHYLPERTHFLHFNDNAGMRSPSEIDSWASPLEIRTKDNNSIRVELSVSYRIRPGEAHQLVTRGWEFSYRHHARNIVKNELRKEGAPTRASSN